MDGYATLNSAQFKELLETAIPKVSKRIMALHAENAKERQEIYDRIWAKRSKLFGPWTEKGCWNRVSDSLGMFGATRAQYNLPEVEKLAKEYQAQLNSLNGMMNGEPYLLSLKQFNRLQEWAE
jgi:hypothetical protein